MIKRRKKRTRTNTRVSLQIHRLYLTHSNTAFKNIQIQRLFLQWPITGLVSEEKKDWLWHLEQEPGRQSHCNKSLHDSARPAAFHGIAVLWLALRSWYWHWCRLEHEISTWNGWKEPRNEHHSNLISLCLYWNVALSWEELYCLKKKK